MGGGGADLRVDPEDVGRITRGLRSAVSELKGAGGGTGAVLGKGLADLSMTGMEAGHHGLSKDFEDFCERWDWGVRALVQDANAIAERLGLAAGKHWEEDRYIEGALKVGLNSVVGNPHASEEEITKKSWGDVATPGFLHPDYSGASFGKARDDIARNWKDTGRALVTEGTGGMRSRVLNKLLGVDQDSFDRGVDEAFGPSPEERARQGDGGNGGG
ncbi:MULTISPECIES: hypothetical protein [Streptomyces]|uniref:hypothetical protein n=1 Tax=Streptomyces TaxID=1883 RepID=UPI00163BA706|nr:MULTISPECIES: hypothetical protein [Streptomyces]MBC2876361.1 hypothetical protein [Streptomyces sp. TYQ1024]UBI35422.1 hypothetical protein K7I03_02380 [Streptomyces mobaraensis]UKW28014.1 hypothetical protein MCU78_02410 [Streptomyces sp. TYQ1024]